MDNEIQGSMVGLWFSKNYVAPLCLIIIWEMRWVLQVIAEGKYPVLQASNEKEKMGMERPHLSTVTVQGWPQKHRTGLSTGQKPQFKTVLTHQLITPILTCPEAEQTCLGCPGDTPAWSLLSWELPRATVPTPSCPAWMLHPWATCVHYTLVISGATPATLLNKTRLLEPSWAHAVKVVADTT